MIDLARRATEKELLDEGVDDHEALTSLADLRFVNRHLGGWRSLRSAVAPLVAGIERPRLLDVGCGSADQPARLAQAFPGLRVVGADVKPLHLSAAPRAVLRVAADVRALPFAPQSFDVVTASLFLHHFDCDAAVGVLRALFALARRGLVVNDLRRAHVPYLFGRVAFPWLFRSQVSVEDGLVSIRRAFTRAELAGLFERAAIPNARIRGSFPYRLVAVARR